MARRSKVFVVSFAIVLGLACSRVAPTSGVVCTLPMPSDPASRTDEQVAPPPDLPREVLESRVGTTYFGPEDLTPCCTEEGLPDWARDPAIGTREIRCSMLCMPSFAPCYSVALVCDEEESGLRGTGDPPMGTWTVFIANPPPKSRSSSRHANPAQGPERAHAELDRRSAIAIANAWELVVRRARNPRPRWEVLEDGTRSEWASTPIDGVSYHFEFAKFRGDAWSPQTALPSGLVDLGDALRSFVRADEVSRPAQLAHCVELAKQLEAAAEKRPW